MDLEFKYGVMVLNMKDNGKTTELRVRANFGILEEIYMKDNGKKIGLAVKEYTYIQMEQSMKESG